MSYPSKRSVEFTERGLHCLWGFLLKPLPYAQPNQLSAIRERLPKIGVDYPLASAKVYLDLKRNLRGVAGVGLATGANSQPIKLGGRTHLLGFERVTPSLLQTLGVAPVLGRLPSAAAGKPGGPPETVISYRFWQSKWGGRGDVLGAALKVNDKTYRIVGVMPKGFFFEHGHVDAWLSFVVTPQSARNGGLYWVVVRRKPGVSAAQLGLELKSARERLLGKASPKRRARLIQAGFTIDAQSLHADELSHSGIGRLPWLLQAAAGLLFLLALANTINLGLVRQRARQHEFALRRVLGATRGGLVRLILIEHLPIALAVGIVAMFLAWTGIGTLHAFGLPPAFSPFKVEFSLPIVVFTWALTLVAFLIVAFGPAFLASGKKLLAALGHGPTAVGGRGPRRLQRGLGIVQVSLACALIVAGGLLGVSLWRILTQPLNFEPQHRVIADVILPHGADQGAAWEALKPRLSSLPGVTGVGVTDMVPFSQIGADIRDVRPAGKGAAQQRVTVNFPGVTSSFFSTLGIKFVAGHPFTAAEVANGAPVVVINEHLARHFFGSPSKAIGRSIGGSKPLRIIGVTHDIAWQSTPDAYKPNTVWAPWGSGSGGLLIAVVRTRGSVTALTDVFKQAIEAALPRSAVLKISTLPDLVQGASVFRAAGAGMVGAFAALALLLAALGVFAITSFIARARLGEYGIRAALGASPLALLRLGFKEAAWLLAIGLPIGLAGAYLLGRVIAGALYQTPVLDPWLYIVGAVLIAAVAFAAAWRPARKAARVPIRDLLGGGGAQ
jgi:predicted permease